MLIALSRWLEAVLRERKDTTACLAITLITLPVMLMFTLMPWVAAGREDIKALYHWELLTQLNVVLIGVCGLLIFIAARSWSLRNWECPIGLLPGLTVTTVFLGILLVSYGYGYHDSPLMLLVMGILIMVRALFLLRIFNLTLLVVVSVFVVAEIFCALGMLPHAPLLKQPIYSGDGLHPWWEFWMRMLYVLIIAPILVLYFFIATILWDKKVRLLELVRSDGLTKLLNRRAFMERFEIESHRHRRYEQPLCLLLCDIDHFKQVNDQHGHSMGDEVLREFSAILSRSVRRKTDLVARFGGEEFVVLLTSTELEHARAIAEHISWQFRTRPFYSEAGESFSVTVSIGVVEMHDEGVDAALHQADNNLYSAKHSGRDQIVASDLALNTG